MDATDRPEERSAPLLFQQPWPDGEYRLFQLGYVVDDAIAAARKWSEAFGVGPFFVQEYRESPCSYRGERTAVSLQIAVAQAGPVQIELIAQLCDRDSVYREFRRTGHTVFHQVCTLVDDYPATLERYRRRGYEIACEFLLEAGPAVAYVDTVADFGFYTEVVGRTEAFVAHLCEVAEAARHWDGTDPVRRPTGNGYLAL